MPPFFSPKFEEMAKRERFKRVVGKDGRVYYYELQKDSRGVEKYTRVSDSKGAGKYVSKNYNSLKFKSKDNLTDREQESLRRSSAQRDLYRFKGKAIPKYKTEILSNLGIFDPKKDKSREITQLPNLDAFQRPSDIDRELNNFLNQDDLRFEIETHLGADGHRGRSRATSIVDIEEQIKNYKQVGFGFVVYTEDGEEVTGYQAYEAVREWEIQQLEDFQEQGDNVAAIRTKYTLHYDPKLGVVWLDLSEAEAEPENSEPIKKKK